VPVAVGVPGLRGKELGPGGAEGLQEPLLGGHLEHLLRGPEPDVGLGVGPLGAEAVQDLLGPHVHPLDVHLGVEGLEGGLVVGEEVATVGGVDHQDLPAVAPAGHGKEEGGQGGEAEEGLEGGPEWGSAHGASPP
jgi:hypothetical protein